MCLENFDKSEVFVLEVHAFTQLHPKKIFYLSCVTCLWNKYSHKVYDVSWKFACVAQLSDILLENDE